MTKKYYLGPKFKIMKNLITILLIIIVISCKVSTNEKPIVKFETEYGDILIELYPDKAPLTCANFLKYIKHNEFKDAHFYRVVTKENQPNSDIKIEVIQGGLGFDVEESAFLPIELETTKTTGIKHLNGTLSMARAKPNTATSEFFICINNQPELDFGGKRNPDGLGFAAFGKVIQGMEIVLRIQSLPNKNQMLMKSSPIRISMQ